jgi:DNA helicase II / ATP-dependent DNA helicase PcrA
VRSQFIGELPPELINSNLRSKGRQQTTAKTTPKSPKTVGSATNQTTGWRVGDRVIHRSFGVGQITHVFGTENKQSVDPKIVGLQKIE